MNSKQIFINMESDKYNLIVEARHIFKIRMCSPFRANLSSALTQVDEKLFLNLKEEYASYLSGNRKLISYFHFLNPFSKTIKIIVPNDLVVNLNINLESGSIFLKNIIFNKANLSSVRGNICMRECSGGEAYIDGYQSDVNLKSISGTDCIVHTKTGNIILENKIAFNTEIKTDIGNIKLTNLDHILKDTNISLSYKGSNHKPIIIQKEKQKKLVLSTLHGAINGGIF